MIWLPIVGIALLLIYEVWAALTHRGLTLSQMVWAVLKHPVVPFVLGFLMGHLIA